MAKTVEAEPIPAPSSTAERRLRRLHGMVALLDSAFEIPGTRWRIGLDALIGLIPGAGDVVSTALAAWIVSEAKALGASDAVRRKMARNVVIDLVVGLVPVLGDVFDVAWKANVRNIRLLEDDLGRPGARGPRPSPALARFDERGDTTRGARLEPRITTAAVIAIVAAIASFTTGAFWGIVLAVVAVLAGVIGMLIATSPRRRGGILSLVAILIGVIAVVRAVLVAVF